MARQLQLGKREIKEEAMDRLYQLSVDAVAGYMEDYDNREFINPRLNHSKNPEQTKSDLAEAFNGLLEGMAKRFGIDS